MYQSDLIIDGIQADKLMALQLEKALSGVKDQALEQACNSLDVLHLLFH